MIVSAYSGALLVERNGESRIVEAGKSYNVSFDPNATPTAQNPPAPARRIKTETENGNGNTTGRTAMSGNGNGMTKAS